MRSSRNGWVAVSLFGIVLVSLSTGCGLHLGNSSSAPEKSLPATFVPSATVGQHLFVQNCASCHSTGTARLYGPGLQDLFAQRQLPNQMPVTVQNVEQWIETGGGDMPSFAYLTVEDRANITAYLQMLTKSKSTTK